MFASATETYLQERVLGASPVELVILLYDGAIAAVGHARECLAAGQIQPRSEAITKALAIVAELTGSLDLRRGGELSRQLAELYEYISRRLLDANLQQQDYPLAEVLSLLNTIADAWRSISDAQAPLPLYIPAGAAHAAAQWSF